ncbi:glycosyltransferase family 25 protein [Devosia sp. SL43]|uniref:glycosyltransferase family 25 protein n=1 Tax=Devosia sp. SL43 TaxID=2806348 RepID=UPI001F2D1041|nr:glycosyltransferase family 25 protein [Devosia sp. SL43]UJW83934.1 glycosyltransferase family 25 protein [Devosia sp. SL43]
MRAYYINLARRPERQETMERRFSELGIVFERIEATTPADITHEQRARFCDPTAYRWQTEGELACSLSHTMALRAFLATNETHAAIFEDDAILSATLPRFMDAFAGAAGNIDVLRLETDNARLRLSPAPEASIAGFAVHQLYNAGGGAAAYIVSRRAAERILDGEEILANLTDQALFNPLAPLSRSLVVRQLVPALAIQEDRVMPVEQRNRLETSDLEPLRRDRGAVDGANFWRRSAYNLYDLWQRDIVDAFRKLWNRYALGVTKTDIPFQAE